MNSQLLRIFTAALLISYSASLAADPAKPGETQILKWKEGKKAVFMLAFDDGCPSHLKYVIPELEKRKVVGTFYLNPARGQYTGAKAQWEAAAKSPYVVVANHTLTHKGVNNSEELEPELAKCNEVLYALHPARKPPYFIPFGHPGGVPWKVTKEELAATLAKHHLIYRPPFAGPPINYKSAEEVIAVVDKAIAEGAMGHLDFHGVGTDWLVTPLDWFIPLMEKLEKERDQLWITDPASLHKYTTEREEAVVRVIEAGKDRIRVTLSAKTDPALYDEPLTLSTAVPSDWGSCVVAQGTSKQEVSVKNGAIQYSALPGTELITIQPK